MDRQTEREREPGSGVKQGRELEAGLSEVAESFDTTEVLPEHRHPAVAPDKDRTGWRPPADVPAVQSPELAVDVVEGGGAVVHPDRNSRGQFTAGNDAWREGQAERLKRASQVRIARLRRTKRLLQTLTLRDMDLTMHVLRGCLLDLDPKVRLAAVRLVLETVAVKDTGDVADGEVGAKVAFVFQIPAALPVAGSG